MTGAQTGDRRSEAAGDGSGTDFHELVLHRCDGSRVSLGGYRGRWMVLHVGREVPCPPTGGGERLGRVAEVRVTTCAAAVTAGCGGEPLALIDAEGHFARAFPGLPLPSTFVVNPAGSLVAIVSDGDYRHLARLIVHERGWRSGAVDGGDIVT